MVQKNNGDLKIDQFINIVDQIISTQDQLRITKFYIIRRIQTKPLKSINKFKCKFLTTHEDFFSKAFYLFREVTSWEVQTFAVGL